MHMALQGLGKAVIADEDMNSVGLQSIHKESGENPLFSHCVLRRSLVRGTHHVQNVQQRVDRS